MKLLACALVLMVAALPLRAEDRSFDLGFAHPGMDKAQFRDHSWAEARVLCSDDDHHPREVDFRHGNGVARVGAVRCGLFAADAGGHWRPRPLTVAGWPGEMWAMFLPDAGGTSRLVHLKLSLPAAAFDDVAREWNQVFGLPSYRRDKVVHWSTAQADAIITVGEGGEDDGRVYAHMMDNSLHETANRRLGQMPAKR